MNELQAVDDLIAHLSSIPPERWTTGVLADGKGARCALGHLCDEQLSTNTPRSRAYSALRDRFLPGTALMAVNDACPHGEDLTYPQATPKERSLAYMADLRAAVVKAHPEQVKPAASEVRA